MTEAGDTEKTQRRIRSFVRRQGRITTGQLKALTDLWPSYGLTTDDGPLNPAEEFGRTAPLTLEIGFGNGASLADMAAAHPQEDFIGVEVHRPGVGHLLKQIGERGLQNIRIYCDDAVDVLNHCLADHSLDRVLLFFPDPWHKKKHHKRRIVQPEFIQLLARKLKPGGYLHMATDWQPYAEQMLEVMEASTLYRNTSATGRYAERPDYRPITKFEQRGHRLGHGVWDLIYQRH